MSSTTGVRGQQPAEVQEDRRVIIHFDLDAFYVACERELNESLRGVPVAVSQYNPYGALEEKTAEQITKRLVVHPDEDPQSNEDRNGSLIAVSYEARAAGVRRNDRGLNAVSKCPQLRIVQVPVKHGKADLTMYRSASTRVMNVLSTCLREEAEKCTSDGIQVEIASIDEVYVDVTRPAHEMACCICGPHADARDDDMWKEFIEEASMCTTIGGVETLSGAAEAANALNKDDLRRGSRLQVLDSSAPSVDSGSRTWWHREFSEWTDVEIRLACGAVLAAKARSAVLKAFAGGVFTLSAGISDNKTLAKLSSGLKKPHRQTLINRMDASGALENLFHPLPLGRIRGLGGKFGEDIGAKLNISTVGQLANVPLSTLLSTLPGNDTTAHFLYDIARGICRDEVIERTKVKSIACGKTFRGKLAIATTDLKALRKWTGELCSELTERLTTDQQQNNRFPTSFVVHVKMDVQRSYVSKSCRAPRMKDGYCETALKLILQLTDSAKSRLRQGSLADPVHESSDLIFIVGLSVGVSSFVDMAAGSSSIVAAFERSSKSEKKDQGSTSTKDRPLGAAKDSSSMDHDSTNTSSGKYPPTSNTTSRHHGKVRVSGLDQWLSPAGTTRQLHQKSSRLGGGSEKQPEKVGTLHRYLNKSTTGTSTTKDQNTLKRALPPVDLPDMDEIDPSVLDAIPENLRLSLMEDLRRQRKLTKRGTIKSFVRQERL